MNKHFENQIILAAKGKYQVFTPEDIVEEMLDLAGYRENILGKRILENSFGDGQFLLQIVQRYIDEARTEGRSISAIREELQNNVVGFETDESLFRVARSRLDDLADSCGLGRVNWDLRHDDALLSGDGEEFHFIVGNPPYVEYKQLEQGYREALKMKFETCASGKFDYCYAFLESAIKRLRSDGVLVQLIPNSIFKNVFASTLRQMLLPGMTDVIDYAGINVFGSALVSPCVLRYSNECKSNSITYLSKTGERSISVDKKSLGEKWVFSGKKKPKKAVKRFGESYRAASPVATLCNRAFLVHENEVEPELTRRAYTPRIAKEGKTAWMIFPYKANEEGGTIRLSEGELKTGYPKAFEHLSLNRSVLENRALDSTALWYEYGRSQGLKTISQKKLLVSTVVTHCVFVHELNEGEIPYGGIVITAVNPQSDLKEAKAILESESFYRYVTEIGTRVSGASIRITGKDIENFTLV